MRTPSEKAIFKKTNLPTSLKRLISDTIKLCCLYPLTYDQAHYVSKAVRQSLHLEWGKPRKRVVERLLREEEMIILDLFY